MAKSSGSARRKWLVVIGVVIGIILTVIAANFVRSEKKVEHVVESPYGIARSAVHAIDGFVADVTACSRETPSRNC